MYIFKRIKIEIRAIIILAKTMYSVGIFQDVPFRIWNKSKKTQKISNDLCILSIYLSLIALRMSLFRYNSQKLDTKNASLSSSNVISSSNGVKKSFLCSSKIVLGVVIGSKSVELGISASSSKVLLAKLIDWGCVSFGITLLRLPFSFQIKYKQDSIF